LEIRAIEKASAANLNALKVRASIHFARKELSSDAGLAAEILKQALQAMKPIKDPDLIGVLQRLLAVLQKQTMPEGQLDKIIGEVRHLLKSSKPPLPKTQ
jgi:hypothetical protein